MVLTDTLDKIASQRDYTHSEKDALARVLLASALFSSIIDHEKELTVQTHAFPGNPLLVGKCTHTGDMRGLVQPEEMQSPDPSQNAAQVVITYFMKASHIATQSVIDLTEPTVESSVVDYLVTNKANTSFVIFHASDSQASAILLQLGPAAVEGETRQAICELFQRGRSVGTQKTYASLLRMLEKVFGQPPSVFFSQSLQFLCHCDRDKMLAAVRLMGESEALDIFQTNQFLDVTCNYCQEQVSFTEKEIRSLFVERGPLH